MHLYRSLGKRALDIAVALVLLVITAPLQAVVTLLIRIRLGTPILFTQERAGKDAEPFTLLKFRTMLPEDPSRGLVSDEDRMTRLGSVLRATSLDELPSLINVVRGDMSLIGPRPLYMSYVPLYSEEQRSRLEVRPGVTGLAQVSGRNALTWEDRFELDRSYVANVTFRKDFLILCRTVGTVLKREGISEEGQATMSAFTGSRPTSQDGRDVEGDEG